MERMQAESKDEEDTTLSDTDVCTILSNDRRRAVLLSLLNADDHELDLRTLSERVADREADGDDAKSHRQSVYVSLHQTHLPKLDDHDVVEYDKDRKTVALVSADHPVIDRLTDTDEDQTGSRVTWIGVLAVGIITVGVVATDVIEGQWFAIVVYLVMIAVIIWQSASDSP